MFSSHFDIIRSRAVFVNFLDSFHNFPANFSLIISENYGKLCVYHNNCLTVHNKTLKNCKKWRAITIFATTTRTNEGNLITGNHRFPNFPIISFKSFELR